ncbi:MAG TPA: 2Fe-2S iron-sulfur cluster-binding protein [Pyrinomonadaceae bacterium]|nr:2Fe-2S iron-sulfur cluster-binding protein [Pyrinomonadaceae bacterium]
MSVNVEWKIDGQSHTGIVAEGTYLWEAAKRMGVRLPADCEGKGTCDTCAVKVEEGATLLSALTNAEREHLSPERLLAGERLACQAKVERGGDLVLSPVPQTERAETTEETVSDIRQEFRKMPLQKKLTTLVELEAVAATQTIAAVADLPFKLFEKGLDLMAGRGRTLARRKREERVPAEHRASDAAPEVVVTDDDPETPPS